MSQFSTLFVRNLVFTGVHGSTEREYLDSQRFQVDIDLILDVSRSATSDRLDDTYDYKKATRVAQEVIERKKYVLIERIATEIAEEICRDTKIHKARVRLTKLDANKNGIPGILVEERRRPQEQTRNLNDFDIDEFLIQLDREGGVSIPMLTEEYRLALLEEAGSHEYEEQPEVVGPAKVREQISSAYEFSPSSLFYGLRDDFQKMILRKLEGRDNPFNPALDLNEMSLQLYKAGSIGITPHMDGLSNRNLVCVFVLTGESRFALCDDREGTNPRYFDTSPGNVIIMRAPGFRSSDFRPFHFVSDIPERRIVFGLRQKISREE